MNLTVKLEEKYKADFEAQFVTMKNASYASVLGSKSVVCGDHFMAPHGCQGSCPFQRFSTKDIICGCVAWMALLIAPHKLSINPPYPEGKGWGVVSPVLSEEIRKHVVFT